jgi:hypothetical protein
VARRPDVEVDRHERATWTKTVGVMSHHCERIRDMKQQQTSGHRIESFVGPPRVDVTLLERDVGHSRILRSLTRPP